MHRLFVAIRPPRTMRERLLGAMGGVPGARWQSDEQLHLTLRFIGEVDRHCAEDVAAALGSIHQPRFNLALDGIGQFERRGQPEAIWAGVTPHGPLKTLHKKIDRTLIRIGLAPESRAYLPHITLARSSRHAGMRGEIAPAAHRLADASAEITEFCLYESALGGEGAAYSIVTR